MEESRKRVIGLMAAILSAMDMQRADDLFGMPNGTPIPDRIIEAILHGWSRPCCCPAGSGSGVDLLPHDLSTPEPRRKMKMLEALSKKEGPPGKTTRRASI